MSTDRRQFLKQAGLSVAAASLGGTITEAQASPIDVPSDLSCAGLPRQGPKEVIRGKKAVVSAQHPIVMETALDVLKKGGNAADAAVAAAITQSTVQLDMTNHGGTVTCLYHDAKSGKTYQLDSAGTLVPNLPFFRPVPVGLLGSPLGASAACIPGFMPGVNALHTRFGTKPWNSLVEYAIPLAEDGHRMDEFTRSVLEEELIYNTFLPASRAIYAPDGFTPSVGAVWRNPALAQTLRKLADEGPEYFTTGGWAQHFVETANKMGWHIKLADMTANPPRWEEPIMFEHNGYQVVQPAPPQRQALFCSLVLGILKHLDITKLGHYTESAESLYYFAHALRRADFELSYLSDSEFFGVPVDIWTSDDYHAKLANIIKTSRPKTGVDLTQHVMLTSGKADLEAFGWAVDAPTPKTTQPSGSTELSIVDAQGNWVEMMNTLQGGGIPGTIVDGVPMYGTNASTTMQSSIKGWLGVPGSRQVQPMGNTIVFKDGKPFFATGSPGNVHVTVPQVLSNVLDYGMEPPHAVDLPRMLPIRDDFTISIETRIPLQVVKDMAKLGAKLGPLPTYDYHMGSFQHAWRDQKTGQLCAGTDPRRIGKAGGI